MIQRSKKLKIIFLFASVLTITLCHYVTELRAHHYHLVYQGVYFLPIMLAGFWFGLRGALSTSLSITILYIPFTFMHWEGFSGDDFNNLIEMVLYNAVGVILGILRDRERAGQRRLREFEGLASVGKAVSALAHDLKTSLIAIGGLSRSVLKSLEKDGPSRKKMDVIVEETQRLECMVKEMLDFSRPLELRRSREDINHVISQSLAIIADTAQRRKVKVQIQPSQNLSLISFDPPRMKQVLINLLINAIEASPEGGTVSVHKYQKREKLIIDVSDSGCGIPIDKKEEIFFPFFTTKEDGTGLGLPISKKIVEAHEGCLEILENPEGGVTFRVIMPF
jgi:two-component system, NtrC family, sensor histidine kinase HydH